MPDVPEHERRRALREALDGPDIVFAPSCADGISARLVESLGIPAIHCAGSALHRQAGYPDAGVLTLTEMASALSKVCEAVAIPVIADADTGFGGLLNVVRTVREYERAGAAALHLEDQLTPKKPPSGGQQNDTISLGEMVGKISAAMDAREDESLVIIARSEVKGNISEVIDRLASCIEAGADAAWIPGGYSPEDLAELRKAIAKPLVGVLPAGRSLEDFHAAGANCAVLPTWLETVSVLAKKQLLTSYLETGSGARYLETLPDIDESRRFVQGQGSEQLESLNRRFGGF